MTSKYLYKEIDITLDVYEKISATVEELARQDGVAFDEAFEAFSQSDVYHALAEPLSLMWSESVPFIVSEYRMEAA